tara:strand:- start:395 stop:622 length:228 start_codon:yes stop_codon:yes gene_type:complete
MILSDYSTLVKYKKELLKFIFEEIELINHSPIILKKLFKEYKDVSYRIKHSRNSDHHGTNKAEYNISIPSKQNRN